MKRILVPIGCRSDEGLSAPVIKRLQDWFDVCAYPLLPQKFKESYSLVETVINSWYPDLILITGDRVEMCAAAAAAFHNKVKIAHFYAGIINDPVTTYDDVDRHCCTLWSDIQFCEDRCSAIRTNMLKQACDLTSNVHVVGISHLDDLEVDESKDPLCKYDLLLINNEPLSSTNHDFMRSDGRPLIQIGHNPDGNVQTIGDIYYGNLPRPQFLGLLKNCQRFITNSSAAIYEAPHFLKPEQIVMVGDRNKNRPKGPFKTGASDRIVEILKEYLK
jgi:hypothetical protein